MRKNGRDSERLGRVFVHVGLGKVDHCASDSWISSYDSSVPGKCFLTQASTATNLTYSDDERVGYKCNKACCFRIFVQQSTLVHFINVIGVMKIENVSKEAISANRILAATGQPTIDSSFEDPSSSWK
ncbi:unnamed protein product [Phytophthora fragariaefolia]|uniref:Unnamed protein product n=1 Tax=Phytophthora fragariaefolia TaxID=1490495 RepID=A0A9W6U1M5_9STRA|nr:unnamed protein product [Phytophthora fragariaefolia]